MTIPMPLRDHEVHQALEIARGFARVGTPVFVAEPCAGANCNTHCRRRTKGQGTVSGFHLPYKWEKIAADPAAVDAWRPGWALCAVGGVAADFLDTDPRHGGTDTVQRLAGAGHWPHSYGRAATPSGGFHDVIAPLRVGTAAPIGKGSDDPLSGLDLRGGRPDGDGRGFIYLAPTVRPSKTDGVPRPYRWLQIPDFASLVTHGPADRSGAALALRVEVKQKTKGKGRKETDADDFFSPGMSADAANKRIRARLDAVTMHARQGWEGFRDTLIAAAFELGGYVGAEHLSFEDAEQALVQAVINASTPDNPTWPNSDDQLWIRQGLEDGAEEPLKIRKPPPLAEARPVVDDRPTKTHKLPLISDAIWEQRGWLRAIRDRARRTADSPDGVLGAALAVYAASVPHNVKVVTGIRRPIGFSLLVGLVSKSGRGKSSAWGLACDEFAPLEAAPICPIPTGEGISEKLMGWEEKVDPMTGKTFKARVQTSFNAAFHIDEGEALNAGMVRDGSSIGSTMRALFSDQQLGNANANDERKRNVPRGMYSLALVVGYQPSTAMKIVRDTSTGMAQRFLWFSARRQPTADPGVEGVARFCLPLQTSLQAVVAPDGKQQYLLPVAADVAALIRRESDERDSADDNEAEDDVDSQKPVVMAKLAGLACLIEGRSLITMGDWELAGELYDASARVRDSLIEIAEEQDRTTRREAAVKAGESDFIRRSYFTTMDKVAASIVKRARKAKEPITKRDVTLAITSKRRPYLSDALEHALESGWLEEKGDKYTVGKVPLPDELEH